MKTKSNREEYGKQGKTTAIQWKILYGPHNNPPDVCVLCPHFPPAELNPQGPQPCRTHGKTQSMRTSCDEWQSVLTQDNADMAICYTILCEFEVCYNTKL